MSLNSTDFDRFKYVAIYYPSNKTIATHFKWPGLVSECEQITYVPIAMSPGLAICTVTIHISSYYISTVYMLYEYV